MSCNSDGHVFQQAASLFQTVDVVRRDGSLKAPVAQLCYDSRKVQAQSLFVALRGRYHDGHAFVEQAYERGACVVVGERSFSPPPGKTYVQVADSRRALAQLANAFYAHPTRRLFVVGITGTKGKTSVAHFSAAALGNARCLSTITNVAEGLLNTTPESLEVQRLAAEALQRGRSQFVLEVSSHALVTQRVLGLDVDVAVFTNLSQDHFDDFDGFEAYFEAKAQLFKTLKPTAVALLNEDDPYGRRLIEQTPARVVRYGLRAGVDLRATELQLERDRSYFKVHTPLGSFPLSTHFPGAFNVYNLLAAVGVGLAARVPVDQIVARLEAITHLDGRFERYRTTSGVTVVVDFAHSPDSLQQMIAFLKQHYGRVLTLFGCGGESDSLKRPLMGRISGELSDYTLITHDNPKHENPQSILDQIEAGIRPVCSNYEVVPDRRAALRRALAWAGPGECVLVAGKGHERSQIFGSDEVPFHDGAFVVNELGATRC